MSRRLIDTLEARCAAREPPAPPCPADSRIQAFLDAYLADVCPAGAPRLPADTLVLERAGQARELSLPQTSDALASPYLSSWRTQQGVLHNPKSDRRTTQGVFHIADGGFPVPDDKRAVPKQAFAALLARALEPPPEVLTIPYTVDQQEPVRAFVSLLMRPLVCPATDEDPAKSMEIRFFAPGSLISNLDFVEGIFGNAGDPRLPENDAGLDVQHWTGHSGAVILAPHLLGLGKKELGLPPFDQATERQRRDGMCWKTADEPYNDGSAFKVTCRDHRGVMVTLIADNYFGYCKKEVKTQISYAANLFGLAEEEHAGGALAYPTYILGEDFHPARSIPLKGMNFEAAMARLGDSVERRTGRWAVDRRYPDVLYVPEDAEFHAAEGRVSWVHAGQTMALPLRGGDTWILPSGYKVRLQKRTGGSQWCLVGTRPDGTLCHKPCTVSGGGKSEISKSIASMVVHGPVIVKEFHGDLARVEEVVRRDFSTIYRHPRSDAQAKRPLLSPERSLGSAIKLLTPSAEYTDEYNAWVRGLPQTLRQLVFVLKRYYQPAWGDAWREHFSVDRINGYPGHELKFDERALLADYLRVGYDRDGSWRMYALRPDYFPSDKVQCEDDITVSVVVPRERLPDLIPDYTHPSVKLVANCESLLFQRPDDAIRRGVDAQAEADIATAGTFLSNFEPITQAQARQIVDHTAEFDRYTQPMQELLAGFARKPAAAYVVASDSPRLVDGKPSKNPRYLQQRPDRVNHRETYIAEVGARLNRGIAADRPVYYPVRAVLAGRRNNPPDPSIGLPPLAVYNPIHYQELPELFMDFIASLTGKSPSTTGFGSEGALTKGPFNALWPVVDLNNALVSYILTGYAGFTTSAGHLGPHCRVDHDISMLVPEVWCRMEVHEREPDFLIGNGFLERVADFDADGRRVLASRLGYRITSLFVDRFMGRIFETPNAVFTAEMLRPELQDPEAFAAGVDAIVEAQTRVAQGYFRDGSAAAACPPLRALLHIMAEGDYEGMDVHHPAVRDMFTREALLASEWYRERLLTKQRRDIALWRRHLETLERSVFRERLPAARAELARVTSPDYLASLVGTLGADPLRGQWPQE
jgi:hypothetical protein